MTAKETSILAKTSNYGKRNISYKHERNEQTTIPTYREIGNILSKLHPLPQLRHQHISQMTSKNHLWILPRIHNSRHPDT